MRPVTHLCLSDSECPFVVSCDDQLTERLGAGRIAPLPDQQRGGLLKELHGVEERSDARLDASGRLLGLDHLDRFFECLYMLWGRPAASAKETYPVKLRKLQLLGSELIRPHRIVGVSPTVLR